MPVPGRLARRQALRKLYPDSDIGHDDPRAPLGFCPTCGLRLPCNACLEEVVRYALIAEGN